MGVDINKVTTFGPQGFLIGRNNPDGTPVTPDRVLGFYGTVDLSSIGTQAYLGFKIDSDDEIIVDVDWSAAADNTAVTVAEMVVALAAALLVETTDIECMTDPDTDRLLVYYSGAGSPTFLQCFSVETDPTFAALLDFGQGQDFGGNGAIFYECFDNTKAVGFPKNIKDSEEIELESGDGTLVTVIVPAIIKGSKPVITHNDNDYRVKEVIQGGTWAPATSEYTPPMSSQTEKPIFALHIFAPAYDKGSNKRSNKAGMLYRIMYSMSGIEGDETLDTKTLTQTTYNCDATEWEDENNDKQPYYHDQLLSNDEYTALDVENIEPILTYST